MKSRFLNTIFSIFLCGSAYAADSVPIIESVSANVVGNEGLISIRLKPKIIKLRTLLSSEPIVIDAPLINASAVSVFVRNDLESDVVGFRIYGNQGAFSSTATSETGQHRSESFIRIGPRNKGAGQQWLQIKLPKRAILDACIASGPTEQKLGKIKINIVLETDLTCWFINSEESETKTLKTDLELSVALTGDDILTIQRLVKQKKQARAQAQKLPLSEL